MVTFFCGTGFALVAAWFFADALSPEVKKTRSWYVTPLVGGFLFLVGVIIYLTS